jgi:hypothetical protein
MAQYYGGVSIPHDTWDAFFNATIGNGYDYDMFYGNQCWDYCQELWFQYGMFLYLGGNGYAYEAWTVSKDRNLGQQFEAINNLADVKKGDCIVWSASFAPPTGHISFAAEDYNGSGYILSVGQNQESPSATLGHPVTQDRFYVAPYFLGAFRNKEWKETPPPPPPTKKKEKFPWPIAWKYWHYK